MVKTVIKINVKTDQRVRDLNDSVKDIVYDSYGDSYGEI